jgi:DNA-binding CsgD family transcriptional regulator
VRVVVGVDGSGRTHRLARLAGTDPDRAVEWITAPVADAETLAARLGQAAAVGRLVVADDVHRLDDAALRVLTSAVRSGLDLLVSRRPAIGTAALAELDDALAHRGGDTEDLHPLDAAGLMALMATLTGRPPAVEDVERVLAATAGLPALAALIALAPPAPAVPPLAARVERRVALLPPGPAELVRLLAVGVAVPDDVLAEAARLPRGELPAALRILADEGLLAPGTEHLIPAVAEAVDHIAGPAGRRAVRERLAAALVAGGADPLLAAPLLRAARARGPAAAAVFVAAAEKIRLTAPSEALGWLDDADDAGGLGPERPGVPVRAIRAEAAALLGVTADVVPGSDSPVPERIRLQRVEAAVAAHQGRTDRCADLLAGSSDALDRLLAVPALVATGRRPQSPDPDPDPDPGSEPGPAPAALRRLAEAALAATDPLEAVPRFIDAAETAEADPPPAVLPDTPHALGALVAVCAGDTATAEHLLTGALTSGIGGPVAGDRHRLLLGWVRMRAGRYDTARAEVRRLDGVDLSGRDRLLLAALAAGLARRSGDIARLRQAWTSVEPVLARRAVDLLHVEVVEELAVAAARLRHPHRIAPVLDLLDRRLSGLGRPAAWQACLEWIRLQMGVASDDAEAVRRAADDLARIAAGGHRLDALRRAAGSWAAVTQAASSGAVDVDRIGDGVEALAAAELPWEGSRLAGQAAITAADAAVTRRLLERARELSASEPPRAERPGSAPDGAPPAAAAGLSEREVEVSRLVLEGRTHREIGAQLYLSPKTVEHHVARIRTKLGTTTRAEFLAALRDLLG